MKCLRKAFSHPYLTYVNKPDTKKQARQHNNLGYRNTEDFNFKDSINYYKILCLGGSTTYGQGVSIPKDTWPEIYKKTE